MILNKKISIKKAFIRCLASVFLFFQALTISAQGPGADDCSTADNSVNRIYLPYAASGDLCAATANYVMTTCGVNGFTSGKDWVYVLDATITAPVTINLKNIVPNVTNASVSVWQANCPDNGGTCVTGSGASLVASQNITLTFNAVAGQRYYIVVDNSSSCFKYDIYMEYIFSSTCNPACTNIGFENDFAGWVGTSGNTDDGNDVVPIALYPVYEPTLIGTSTSQHTIMTGSGVDFYGGFPVVFPGGGTKSIKLGDDLSAGKGGATLEQKFMVTSANNYFAYNYAVVIEDAGHPSSHQPYFKVDVVDEKNVPINCGQYLVVGGPSIPNFTQYSNDDIYYRPWTTVGIDLSAYVGKCVTVRFSVGDCSDGAHAGYAYIDATCGSLVVSATPSIICSGQSTVLTGPAGGSSYSWSPGGATTSAITVTPTSTTTYTVTMGSYIGAGCGVSATSVVTVTPAATASFTVTPGSCNRTASITNSSSGGASYSWNFGDATTVSGTNPSPHTYASAGTYTVTLTVTNAACSATATRIVTVTDTPVPAITGTNTTCSGSGITLTGTGGGTYSWNTGATSAAITVSPVSTTTYTVTITVSGCTANATHAVTVNTTTAGITGTNSICSGTGTTLTGTGGGTYSWNTGATSVAIAVSPGSTTTYTVIVTAAGCTAMATQAVTVNALPTLTIGSTNTACGGSVGTATVTATGTATFTYLWSPGGQTTATATGLSSGSYNVTVTDGNGCTISSSVSVNNSSGPATSLSSQGNVLCKGSATGTATVTGAGGTGTLNYSWSPGGQTTSTVTGLTAGTYICTVTDANGCASGQSVTITQPSTAIGSGISSQNNVSCTGSATGSATVTASGGTGAFTYLWSPGGQTTASVTGLTVGVYSVIVTDNNGCTSGQSVTLTQPASALGSAINGQSNVNCTGSATGSAAVTGTGGTPSYTYLWNNGKTTDVITGLTAGIYNVTITDANGCTTTQSVAITQPASALSSTINGQSNVSCTGNATGTATVTGTGGTPPYMYSWNLGGQTTATITGLTSGTYNVTLTDAVGCTALQTVVITQPSSSISLSIGSVNATCGNSNGIASITATGGTPGYTYGWVPSGGANSTATNLPAGSYSVTVTDNNGCTQVAAVSVNNSNGPTIGIGSQTNVLCNGASTGSATVTATGGAGTLTYLWNPGGQTTSTINGLTAGTYSVTVTDANGCSQQQQVTLTEPLTTITNTSGSTNAACGSSNGTVSVTALGGTSPYAYNWSTGATTPSAGSLTAGTYSVTITDNNGCSQTTMVTVNGSPGPIAVVSSQSNITCNGLTNGTATVTVSSGTTPYTYAWIPNVTTKNTINSLSANTYTVTVSDSAGCKDTVTFTITEPLPMLFTLSVSDATVCAGESLTILTTVPSGGTPPFTFNWLPNGPVVSPLVATTYSVTVTDSSGCISKTDTIRVTPLPVPIAGFDTISSGLLGQNYNFIDISKDGILWHWDFGDGTTSSMQNPKHIYPKAGTYTVTQIVTAASGCSDTITKIIVIYPNVLIPNVFTPNHDGVNDEFWIPNTGFESFELGIYDRWGLKLFASNQGQIRWDGRTMAGEEVPDGTYYFLLNAIRLDRVNYQVKGFINLTR